jgi:phage tail tape-measure protein
MLRTSIVAVVFASMLALGGCSAPMTHTERGAAVGTLGGAAAGGIIGAIAGNAGMGAAIGAGTGLVGGFLYGRHQEEVQFAYDRGRADAEQGRYGPPPPPPRGSY